MFLNSQKGIFNIASINLLFVLSGVWRGVNVVTIEEESMWIVCVLSVCVAVVGDKEDDSAGRWPSSNIWSLWLIHWHRVFLQHFVYVIEYGWVILFSMHWLAQVSSTIGHCCNTGKYCACNLQSSSSPQKTFCLVPITTEQFECEWPINN